MTRETKERARNFRAAGMRPKCAIDAARTVEQWETIGGVFDEDGETVRIRSEWESEGYFDVYGMPEAYTNGFGRHVSEEEAYREIVGALERCGCFYMVAEYKTKTGEWDYADGIGMMVYRDIFDPTENYYLTDMMRAAMDEWEREHDPANDYVEEMAV